MSKKLNILFISSWYPSRVFTNNGDFVQRHAEAIATRHSVSVIHVVTDNTLAKKKEVVSFKKNNVHTTLVYLKQQKFSIIKYYIFFTTYVNQIKRLKNVDLIHLNITYPTGILPLYFNIFYNIPYVISEHSTFYQTSNTIPQIKKFLLKKIIKRASFVCPVSSNLKNVMIDLGLKGNFHPIPNVVNTSIFEPKKANLKDFVITHISHMGNAHKNVEGIINSVSKLKNAIPNYKLKLIGTNANRYSSYVKDLNIKNVSILNEIPHDTIAEELQMSNVLVLFSNYENLPCVILEAFSCGTPVIATNVGGISEYFPKDFGYLIPKENEAKLTDALLKVYHKELKNDSLKMHNYVEENFGIETICESFSQLYYKSL